MYGTWNLNKISLKEGGVAFNTQGCVRTALQPFMKTQHDYWKEAHDRVMAEIAALSKTMNYTVEDTVPNKHFKYIIDVPNMLDFHNTRKWLSDTYGYTEDLKKDQPKENVYWAFTVNWRDHKIYLRGDEELSWFKIRYGEAQ